MCAFLRLRRIHNHVLWNVSSIVFSWIWFLVFLQILWPSLQNIAATNGHWTNTLEFVQILFQLLDIYELRSTKTHFMSCTINFNLKDSGYKYACLLNVVVDSSKMWNRILVYLSRFAQRYFQILPFEDGNSLRTMIKLQSVIQSNLSTRVVHNLKSLESWTWGYSMLWQIVLGTFTPNFRKK